MNQRAQENRADRMEERISDIQVGNLHMTQMEEKGELRVKK